MTKRKTIAVDIDEVLILHNAALARLHNKLFETEHTVDDYHDDWPALWGVDREEAERRADIWRESKEWIDRHEQVIEGALEGLTKLKEHYNLVIVTGRSKNVAEFTEKWLEETFPDVFSEVHFIGIWEEGKGRTKAEICKQIQASYIIEDSMEQARKCAQIGVETLLFGDYNWNQIKELPKNITRVADWKAVLEYFYGRD